MKRYKTKAAVYQHACKGEPISEESPKLFEDTPKSSKDSTKSSKDLPKSSKGSLNSYEDSSKLAETKEDNDEGELAPPQKYIKISKPEEKLAEREPRDETNLLQQRLAIYENKGRNTNQETQQNNTKEALQPDRVAEQLELQQGYEERENEFAGLERLFDERRRVVAPRPFQHRERAVQENRLAMFDRIFGGFEREPTARAVHVNIPNRQLLEHEQLLEYEHVQNLNDNQQRPPLNFEDGREGRWLGLGHQLRNNLINVMPNPINRVLMDVG